MQKIVIWIGILGVGSALTVLSFDAYAASDAWEPLEDELEDQGFNCSILETPSDRLNTGRVLVKKKNYYSTVCKQLGVPPEPFRLQLANFNIAKKRNFGFGLSILPGLFKSVQNGSVNLSGNKFSSVDVTFNDPSGSEITEDYIPNGEVWTTSSACDFKVRRLIKANDGKIPKNVYLIQRGLSLSGIDYHFYGGPAAEQNKQNSSSDSEKETGVQEPTNDDTESASTEISQNENQSKSGLEAEKSSQTNDCEFDSGNQTGFGASGCLNLRNLVTVKANYQSSQSTVRDLHINLGEDKLWICSNVERIKSWKPETYVSSDGLVKVEREAAETEALQDVEEIGFEEILNQFVDDPE